MLIVSHCYKCGVKFEDNYACFSICYVCRKSFCRTCTHKHKLVEKDTELHDIIKEKTNFVYTPLKTYNWGNLTEIELDTRMQRLSFMNVLHQKTDFNSFNSKICNAKERFIYVLIRMILRKRIMTNDVLEHAMSFL